MSTQKADIGLIGLSTMGQNMALNIKGKGLIVAGFNREKTKTDYLVKRAQGKNILPAYSLKEFTKLLKVPRKILLLIKAGEPVDEVINLLLPILEKGDLIIDGGNSHFLDTHRRGELLKKKGILFLGMGVSGGKEGALKGPSLMPGGDHQGFELVREILEKAAAKTNGQPCCTYLGPQGAGHFVKMVHNGIEYAVMGLIAETYDYLRKVKKLPPIQIARIFARYKKEELDSYLVQIVIEVLKKKEDKEKKPLIDLVLDKVGQKGTGKWTVQTAMDLGVSVPSIAAAVEERNLSFLKDLRSDLTHGYPFKKLSNQGVENKALFQALSASVLVTYAQGFSLLLAGSQEYQYGLNLRKVAQIWQAGCIIRSQLLKDIKEIFNRQPFLGTLLLSSYFVRKLKNYRFGWQKTVASFIENGIPCLTLAASLNYFSTIIQEKLPANLLALLRDRFGAHGFERVDKKGSFYVEW